MAGPLGLPVVGGRGSGASRGPAASSAVGWGWPRCSVAAGPVHGRLKEICPFLGKRRAWRWTRPRALGRPRLGTPAGSSAGFGR